jgi:hypothetical protein
VQPEAVFGRFWLASPRGAFFLGVVTVGAMAVAVPFLILDGFGIWLGLIPFAIVGAVIARRQPGNPVGPILLLLLLTFAIVASSDAGQYALLHYRRGHHSLPLARLAVFLAPGGWLWLIVFLPLPLALFPDGRLSQRWRRVLRAGLAFCAFFVATVAWQNAHGVLAKHIQVDGSGQLASNGTGSTSPGDYAIIALYLAFTLRLRDPVDLDTVRSELLHAVDRAVEPAHASLWLRAPGSRVRVD